jgi:pimeloyl-ACP methyl ester carboxylesterase
MRTIAALASAALLLAGSGCHEPDLAYYSRTHLLVDHGAVTIDTIVEGTGPAVVLLPSLARDSEDYDAVAEGLVRNGFRVLRPQPRGIGKSRGKLDGITLHDFARDVAEVIRQLGGGRAVVVGHAYGNWVARMAAVDHPALIRGVVIAAAASKEYDPRLRLEIDKAGDAALSEEIRLAALRKAFFAQANDPRAWLSGWHPEVREAQRAAAAAVPQKEWWPAGVAPLLDLQADSDPFRVESSRQEMKNEFGDRVTVVVIKGASHALFPERPREVAAALADWIARLPE